jgi:hypothetical protein
MDKKFVKKVNFNVVSNHVIQKSDVVLTILQFDVSILQFVLPMAIVLQIET